MSFKTCAANSHAHLIPESWKQNTFSPVFHPFANWDQGGFQILLCQSDRLYKLKYLFFETSINLLSELVVSAISAPEDR